MGDSTLPSVNVPEYPDDSIEDSLPIGGIAADNPEVDYMLVPAASSCGGDKLTDTNGFSYGVKRKNDKRTLWRCSVCNRHVTCKATVLQVGNSFTRGPHPHLHPGQPGITRSLQTRKQINSMALSDIFTSAVEITEKVQAEHDNNEPIPALPSNAHLAQNANWSSPQGTQESSF